MHFHLRITSDNRTVVTTERLSGHGYCETGECPAPADNLLSVEGGAASIGYDAWACEDHIAGELLAWLSPEPIGCDAGCH